MRRNVAERNARVFSGKKSRGPEQYVAKRICQLQRASVEEGKEGEATAERDHGILRTEDVQTSSTMNGESTSRRVGVCTVRYYVPPGKPGFVSLRISRTARRSAAEIRAYRGRASFPDRMSIIRAYTASFTAGDNPSNASEYTM